MIKMNIKPLSVNEVWQGRRFKTDTYKVYEKELLLTLPAIYFDTKGKRLRVKLEFGFSNKSSDVDNPTKPFLDILQKKYGFNDSQIYQLYITKTIVKKGKEYASFQIFEYE